MTVVRYINWYYALGRCSKIKHIVSFSTAGVYNLREESGKGYIDSLKKPDNFGALK